MQRLEVSGAVRPLEWSLGVKGLTDRQSNTVGITAEIISLYGIESELCLPCVLCESYTSLE